MLRWLLLCPCLALCEHGSETPETNALLQFAAQDSASSNQKSEENEPPCPTGGKFLNGTSVTVAWCLQEGTPDLKEKTFSIDQIMEKTKPDAESEYYKAFCGDIEDSVCQMAYAVLENGYGLGVISWLTLANNPGSDDYGSTDLDICQAQTNYAGAAIADCETLGALCRECAACCKDGGNQSPCYKALRPILRKLTHTYTRSVKWYLALSVRTVNLLKYIQKVALLYSIDSAYDEVKYERAQMVKPPEAKSSIASAILKTVFEALAGFTSVLGPFKFFKEAMSYKVLAALTKFLKVSYKVVTSAMDHAAVFNSDLGGWIAQPNSPLFETEGRLSFEKDDVKKYYMTVYPKIVRTVKSRIGNLVSSSEARELMANQQVSLEGVLSKAEQSEMGQIMGEDGFCIPKSQSPDTDTLQFEMVNAMVRYETFKSLMPVSYRVCAENGYYCKRAPMERIAHARSSEPGHPDLFKCQQRDCNPSACFLSRVTDNHYPLLFRGRSSTSDAVKSRATTPSVSNHSNHSSLQIQEAVGLPDNEPRKGKNCLKHCSGCECGETVCYHRDATSYEYYPNHVTCDDYCPGDTSRSIARPTTYCKGMRSWTKLSSMEMHEDSYSAWLCGWESDDDFSQLYMPTQSLMNSIDYLVQLFANDKSQSLGTLLKANIAGGTRWKSTLVGTGWDFHITRFPDAKFINSDDGKMMIYDQQIAQGCNWYKRSGACMPKDQFKSGKYEGKCGNEPYLCPECGTNAEAPELPVQGCAYYNGNIDYCKDWCNVGGRWGCGIATHDAVTCDCSGCNGCPLCETVLVGPSGTNEATSNLSNPSLQCPSEVNQHNWLSGDKFDDRFKVTKEGKQVIAKRVDSSGGWGLNLAFQCCQ